SGLGALRRRPDARWRKSPADVAALGPLQRSLLRSAIDAARPGGVIAYVTCLPHVAETRAVGGEVTAARGGGLLRDTPALHGEGPDLACPGLGGRYAQFWPHLHGTDAIFLALLQRVGPGGAPLEPPDGLRPRSFVTGLGRASQAPRAARFGP